MKNLWDIKTIKEICSKYNFSFSKKMGQNFLIDPSVCPKMAEYAVEDDDTSVIEIGPGIGILTAELAKKAKKVVAVELDKRLLPVLNETLSEFSNVEILNQDIMKIDINSLIKEKFGDGKVVVCANLPYYITSPIIMYFLESRAKIESMTVMVQKEAADRLCAKVGTREAGAVTVAVDYYSQAEKLFDVSRGSFMPAPNVDSMVMKLNIRKEPEIKLSDEKKFFSMVKAAFAQRRKTVVNSISSGLGIDKKRMIDALKEIGIDENIRAEKLNMNELSKLFEALKL